MFVLMCTSKNIQIKGHLPEATPMDKDETGVLLSSQT